MSLLRANGDKLRSFILAHMPYYLYIVYENLHYYERLRKVQMVNKVRKCYNSNTNMSCKSVVDFVDDNPIVHKKECILLYYILRIFMLDRLWTGKLGGTVVQSDVTFDCDFIHRIDHLFYNSQSKTILLPFEQQVIQFSQTMKLCGVETDDFKYRDIWRCNPSKNDGGNYINGTHYKLHELRYKYNNINNQNFWGATPVYNIGKNENLQMIITKIYLTRIALKIERATLKIKGDNVYGDEFEEQSTIYARNLHRLYALKTLLKCYNKDLSQKTKNYAVIDWLNYRRFIHYGDPFNCHICFMLEACIIVNNINTNVNSMCQKTVTWDEMKQDYNYTFHDKRNFIVSCKNQRGKIMNKFDQDTKNDQDVSTILELTTNPKYFSKIKMKNKNRNSGLQNEKYEKRKSKTKKTNATKKKLRKTPIVPYSIYLAFTHRNKESALRAFGERRKWMTSYKFESKFNGICEQGTDFKALEYQCLKKDLNVKVRLKKCANCSRNQAKYLCSRCGNVRYCNRKCQKIHWALCHWIECEK